MSIDLGEQIREICADGEHGHQLRAAEETLESLLEDMNRCEFPAEWIERTEYALSMVRAAK